MTSTQSTGALLRTLRADLSLREAAKKLDCDFTYLSKIETGSMSPSWKFLKRAFKVYKVPKQDQIVFAYRYIQKFEAFGMVEEHRLSLL